MPNKIAVVDYRRCHPEECENGVCLAVLACPKKILSQEEPFEIPDPLPTICLSCGKCVQACPMEAVLLV
jgi:translation initiation factor RLI1